MNEIIKNFLEIIQYEYIGLSTSAMVLRDAGLEREYLDVADFPVDLISDDQTRRIECSLDPNQEYIHVCASNNVTFDSNIQFYSASRQSNTYGNCHYSFEFEKDGSLYDVVVDRNNSQEMCYYRMLDVVEGKPQIVSIVFDGNCLSVSKTYDGRSEAILFQKEGENQGTISFQKGKKLLGVVPVSGNMEHYFASVLSSVSSVLETSNDGLSKISSPIYKGMIQEFPCLKQLISYQEKSYEADLIDPYLRKYNILIDPDSIFNVK